MVAILLHAHGRGNRMNATMCIDDCLTVSYEMGGSCPLVPNSTEKLAPQKNLNSPLIL